MKPKLLLLLVLFIIVYGSLLFLPMPSQETLDKYNLTITSARLLNLSIFIPIVILWFTAFFGYDRFSKYQDTIADSKEGVQVEKLKKGLFILALGLPLTSILSNVLSQWAVNNPDAEPTSIILKNYLNLVVPLIGFIFISWGSRGLANLSTRQRPAQYIWNSLVFITLLLGLGYVYLLASAPGTITESYHLTTGVFLFTIILPYAFMWFLGLVAAYDIYIYSRKVKGIVYRESWRLLSFGLMAIIIFSILLQYLGTLSTQLETLSLSWLLVIIYLLLVMWALSYVLVAFGAKKLQKIEEV